MAKVATASVRGRNGYAVDIHSGGHALAADEPASVGGTDTGPSPFALVLSGLGACTAITLRMYADRKRWDLGEIRVRLAYTVEETGGQEQRRIEREVRFGASLDERQLARLRDIAEKTPVTRALKAGATIVTDLG